MYTFNWNDKNNELLSITREYKVKNLLDKQDLVFILDECEVLDIIDSFLELRTLSEDAESQIFELRQMIKQKIESDALYRALKLIDG